MAPRIDAPLVGPLAPVAAPGAAAVLGDPRQQAFQRALQALVGSTVPAQVLARLADGSALVRVAGTNARMMLPAGLDAGAELPLTVVAAQPRPTFQLGSAADGSPHLVYGEADLRAPGAAAAAYARSLAAGQLLPADGTREARSGVGASLSPAARLISGALAAHPAQQEAALRPTAPLLHGPGASPTELAAALRNAVDGSGLFYEAHLAEWAQGTRTLEHLGQEPQMQHPPADDTAAARFIGPQLAAQEQQRLAWHGELLPGQLLDWELRRDKGRDGGGDGAADGEPPAAAWHSGLRLRFQALGEIRATITLQGALLDIRLQAGSTGTGELLRGHAGELAAALAAAGTPVAALTVGVQASGRDD